MKHRWKNVNNDTMSRFVIKRCIQCDKLLFRQYHSYWRLTNTGISYKGLTPITTVGRCSGSVFNVPAPDFL